MSIPASVVILTYNEEIALSGCLDSISWCKDIQIVDSGSTDNTLEIARAYKIPVLTHQFENFAAQRNWAIDTCRFKYEWILFLDADERSTPEFFNELSQKIDYCDSSISGFYCCPKMILNNVWLKHSDNFPKWQLRVLRFGKARFIACGHGQKELFLGKGAAYIQEPYLHYFLIKGWDDWWRKHKNYALEEARFRSKVTINWESIHSNNSSLRNYCLKSIVSLIPGYPLLRFLFTYIFNLGFIEGYAGFKYCLNIAIYEFMIQYNLVKRLLKTAP